MNYKTMMRDAASYIEQHINEALDAESMGQLYSYTPAYFNYLFSAYYMRPLDEYIKDVREKKENHIQISTGFCERKMPKADDIEIHTVQLDDFYVGGEPVVQSEESLDDPMKAVTLHYERVLHKKEFHNGEGYLSLWWHDENYAMEYLLGIVYQEMSSIPECEIPVRVQGGQYAIFSLREEEGQSLETAMKKLVHYVYGVWLPQNEEKSNRLGSMFQCVKNQKAYLCLPLLEAEKQEPRDTVYSVEIWTKYIDDHITMNLTTTALAEQFHYSDTHFKRIFRYYYKMSVADYIRKRRLHAAAEEIRKGNKCTEVATKFNFKTYAGFSRAFQKEFNMSPAVYRDTPFEVVDLAQYYKEYKDSLNITFLTLQETKMIGQSVLQGKGEETDIPAQVCYWLDKDFPCMENTRFSCNKERREEKIALWYHMPERSDIEYILGPVVEQFDEDIPEEMIKVTIAGGRYAVFETDKESDKDNLAETIRMYIRCAFYGWIKEHEDMVDLERITFERYADNKIYLYVPIK